MSKFQLRIAGAPDTEIVCAKIGALCAFHNDQSKLDPAFFNQVLSDPETQLLVKLAEDRGQVIGLMAYFPMFRLYSATSGLHLHQLFINESFRGQSYARQFMEYLTNAAAEFGASYITVSADLQNEPTHQVYLSMGFKLVAMGVRFLNIAQGQMVENNGFHANIRHRLACGSQFWEAAPKRRTLMKLGPYPIII